MRYLCGHGRASRLGVAGIVGAEGTRASVDVGSAEEGSSACVDEEPDFWCARRGVLLVGPGLTYSVMSSGMFAGVTLSMNCHEGSSNTIELWSE